ncbi:hypothetical protein EX30DRAFT_177934 [Ascodesmis nigricans]|uniref:TFG box profile domain-containing protein n=1 Tax=Ascodesmis nigricans TaxID=341454 RepID=A0A4V3SHV9_9PEZI|nr:hypothetical protein EX30DRAFT_177934 [Ascodesmis nigricans]
MTEFIGARISLISKSNIRYVGTLHEINSETSTVALEQVVSHGTEGRRGGEDEIPASSNVYEYIVFRGSDVKDLRIEEQPQPKPQPPPPQLDDPAILGHGSRPFPAPQPNQFHPPPMPQYFYPPPQPQQRFGPMYPNPGMYGGFPGGPGQPPMGVPHPGVQSPPMMPPQQPQPPQGPPPQPISQSQTQPQQQPQPQPSQPQAQASVQVPTGPQNRAPPQAPIGPAATRQAGQNARAPQPQAAVTAAEEPKTAVPAQNAVPVPPNGFEATQAPQQSTPPTQPASRVPVGPKARGGIVPALPLPGRSPARPTATVSAPTQPTQSNDAIQALSDKVNNLSVGSQPAPLGSIMATSEAPKPDVPTASTHPNAAPRPRQPGSNNFGTRGGRNNYRGGSQTAQAHKVEVPTTDYDFEAANAKFNKQDLVKEVIASGEDEMPSTEGVVSTNGTGPAADLEEKVIIPPPAGGFYNRGSSFFDNISCENKERAEGKGQTRPRGAAFRSEEQKKNLETFGQGSVDGYGYRGGWRGRGRGRGYGRGRGGNGGYGYSRGGFRQPQQPAAGN